MTRTASQILVSFVLTLLALAQAAQPVANTYEDPQGRFSVPIPTNWSVQEEDGFVTLRDPDGAVAAHLLVAPDGPLEGAVAQAWRRVDPEFRLEPTDVQRPPSEPGVEEAVVTNYETGERIYQGFARRYGGVAYVLLIDADLAAAQRGGEQLNIVASGFEISGLAETDLTGVAPRPVDGAVIAELEASTERARRAFGVPGLTVAVVRGGEIVYTGGAASACVRWGATRS